VRENGIFIDTSVKQLHSFSEYKSRAHPEWHCWTGLHRSF